MRWWSISTAFDWKSPTNFHTNSISISMVCSFAETSQMRKCVTHENSELLWSGIGSDMRHAMHERSKMQFNNEYLMYIYMCCVWCAWTYSANSHSNQSLDFYIVHVVYLVAAAVCVAALIRILLQRPRYRRFSVFVCVCAYYRLLLHFYVWRRATRACVCKIGKRKIVENRTVNSAWARVRSGQMEYLDLLMFQADVNTSNHQSAQFTLNKLYLYLPFSFVDVSLSEIFFV